MQDQAAQAGDRILDLIIILQVDIFKGTSR